MELINRISYFFTKKISPKGLAAFRVFYLLNFLFEIFQVYDYRHLYFDKTPFIDSHFPDTTLLFFLWFGILICLILGWRTKLMSIANYIFTIVLIAGMQSFAYHMFYVYSGINLLLIFLPISTSWSIDFWLQKVKALEKGVLLKPKLASKYTYFLPVFVGLALVYLDSVIFYKIQSPMWLRGLGLWLPSSLPHVTITNFQWFLNSEFLVKFFSHLTLVFEFMFIFLFWNKRFRLILLVIGIGLHLGIYIQFPIPYFAWGCIAFYALMVPVSYWDRINYRRFVSKNRITIFYDPETLEGYRWRKIIESLDLINQIQFRPVSKSSFKESPVVFIKEGEKKVTNTQLKKELFKRSPLFLCLLFFDFKNDTSKLNKTNNKVLQQSSLMMNPKIVHTLFLLGFIVATLFQLQVHFSFLGQGVEGNRSVDKKLMKYLGICEHPVFMDDHFEGYNFVYALKYKNEFLPILDEKGMPADYLKGGGYVNWLWRVNHPFVQKDELRLQRGFINYSAFWRQREGKNIQDRNPIFSIVRRKIRVTFKWEKDLLSSNLNFPWEKVGELQWQNNNAFVKWK